LFGARENDVTREVRIFQPTKTAMQSGRAKIKGWVLEFEPAARNAPDALMGWAGSSDTNAQVKLRFDSDEDAVAHAEKEGWIYTVQLPKQRRIRPKAYADNFATSRIQSWTH
jgi:gamma-glutamylcyclotransferase (GGCT)/AIG2-like uncharacterized protein YtfP